MVFSNCFMNFAKVAALFKDALTMEILLKKQPYSKLYSRTYKYCFRINMEIMW